MRSSTCHPSRRAKKGHARTRLAAMYPLQIARRFAILARSCEHACLICLRRKMHCKQCGRRYTYHYALRSTVCKPNLPTLRTDGNAEGRKALHYD